MSIIRTAILSVVLAFGVSAVSAQDFQKGLAAFKVGDYATALKEWRHLAEQGHAKAQRMLGVMYDNGTRGVLQDYAEAFNWYRLAAKQGNADSHNNLADMYSKGEILDQVAEAALRAHMWFNIASANGHKSARGSREHIAEKMLTSAPASRCLILYDVGHCKKYKIAVRRNGMKELSSQEYGGNNRLRCISLRQA